MHLQGGAIAGVLGHRIFIENVKACAERVNSLTPLKIIGLGGEPLRMDVWVNSKEMTSAMARLVFQVFSNAVDYLRKHVKTEDKGTIEGEDSGAVEVEESFVSLVNKLLGLNPNLGGRLKPAYDGKALFGAFGSDYEFGIETINAELLRKYWK